MMNIPQHVAIILDGNGRWAKSRFLPRTAGHKAGVEAIREVIKEYFAERDKKEGKKTINVAIILFHILIYIKSK